MAILSIFYEFILNQKIPSKPCSILHKLLEAIKFFFHGQQFALIMQWPWVIQIGFWTIGLNVLTSCPQLVVTILFNSTALIVTCCCNKLLPFCELNNLLNMRPVEAWTGVRKMWFEGNEPEKRQEQSHYVAIPSGKSSIFCTHNF